jgi:glycosyltransferase involved in cell wall biosynthesis
MRIALLGTRGIPANYGGFETFYENFGPLLAARGHQVWVYNRPHVVGHRDLRTYRGVNLVHLPSVPSKHLETITHTALSVIHALPRRYDIVYICGVGNTSLAWIPRLTGARVVLNVDSSDWRRAKWGRLPATYLRLMERLSAATANTIVVDNEAVGQHYRQDHGIEAVFVPYGANVIRNEGVEALEQWGLVKGRYVLWVGRLERETLLEELIEAFGRAALPGFKLAIVGDAPFADDYRKQLQSMASADVVFTGRQHGEAYQQLSCHAFAYVQTSPTSGTSPALLDQMAFGNAVIARGTDSNREVVSEAGLTYAPSDPIDGLADAIRSLYESDSLAAALRIRAVERVREHYSWERVTDIYEELFERLIKRRRRETGV